MNPKEKVFLPSRSYLKEKLGVSRMEVFFHELMPKQAPVSLIEVNGYS